MTPQQLRKLERELDEFIDEFIDEITDEIAEGMGRPERRAAIAGA